MPVDQFDCGKFGDGKTIARPKFMDNLFFCHFYKASDTQSTTSAAHAQLSITSDLVSSVKMINNYCLQVHPLDCGNGHRWLKPVLCAELGVSKLTGCNFLSFLAFGNGIFDQVTNYEQILF